MRLNETHLDGRPGVGPRRRLIPLGAATGILILIALATACTRTTHGATGGEGAILAPATATTVALPTPESSGGTGDRTRGSAGDESSRGTSVDLAGPADGDHEADTAAAGIPQEIRSPEALRAAAADDRTGSGRPPDADPGARTHLAPPRRLELAPGPATPDHSTATRPVPLVSSREGSEPPAEVAAAILGAYTAFWASYWEAARQPVNPGHPGIGRHSVEPLRSRTVGVLLGRAAEGVALRLPPDHGTGRVVHIEGWDADSAEVLDCFVDTAVLYEVSTGRVRNDEQATVVHLALLRRQGTDWRVAEIFEQAIHTGRTDGCILQANTHGRRATSRKEPASQAAPEGGGAAGAPQSPS